MWASRSGPCVHYSRARASAPCIILFDEIDALAPRRGGGPLGVSSGTSSEASGVTDRVVNQLLTELDGLESRGRVYVVAATNRPELVDPAVLRPGRVDKLLYVPLPSPDDRVAILRAATRRATLSEDVDLEIIGRDARAEGFSGADLAAGVRDAGLEVGVEREDREPDGGGAEHDDFFERRGVRRARLHPEPPVEREALLERDDLCGGPRRRRGDDVDGSSLLHGRSTWWPRRRCGCLDCRAGGGT